MLLLPCLPPGQLPAGQEALSLERGDAGTPSLERWLEMLKSQLKLSFQGKLYNQERNSRSQGRVSVESGSLSDRKSGV